MSTARRLQGCDATVGMRDSAEQRTATTRPRARDGPCERPTQRAEPVPAKCAREDRRPRSWARGRHPDLLRRGSHMSFNGFLGSARPSLGVELELQLVDARSLALTGAIDAILAGVPAE